MLAPDDSVEWLGVPKPQARKTRRRSRPNLGPRRPRRCRLRLEELEDRTLLAFMLEGIPDWTEQGPGPIRGGQTEGIDDNRVAGAVAAIAAHPSRADVLFVGTVSGGIWKTTSASAAEPTWQPLTDAFPSLSIGSIAFSPLDPAHNTLFAGTGSFSSARPAGAAAGLLRTTDGGDHWRVLAYDQLAGGQIARVLPTSIGSALSDQVVLVASAAGLFRSSDGGETFGPVAGVPLTSVSDVMADPLDPAHFYAGVPGMGVYRSINGGENWQPVLNGLIGHDHSIRIQLTAGSEHGVSVLYAAIIFDNRVLTGLFRSTNGGDNWAAIGTPGMLEDTDADGVPDAPFGLHPGRQGDLHFSMVLDPMNPDVLYIGGDRQPNGSDGVTFPNATGCQTSSARIFRGVPDPDPRMPWMWTAVVCSGAAGTSPHADSRAMTFDAAGDLLEADDGGLYRLMHPSDPASRRWSSANGDLRINEQRSVAYDARNDILFSGNQDTSSTEQARPDDLTWDTAQLGTVHGEIVRYQGDGNTQAVDTSDPAVTLRYSMGNNFRVFFRRGFDAANHQVDLVTPAHPCAGTLEPPGEDSLAARVLLARPGTPCRARTGLYRADRDFHEYKTIPYVLNAVDPARLAIGLRGLYESHNRGDTLDRLQAPASRRRDVSALAYGGREPNTRTPDPTDLTDRPDVLYAARGNVVYVRARAGRSFERYTIPEAITIRDIALDPTNWRTAYVVDAGHVFRISDAATSHVQITDLSGNLADQANLDLHTIELVKSPGSDVLLVGGQGGVFRAINPGPAGARWTEFGRNLPNVLITDLDYVPADPAGHLHGDVLVAGTLGRGTWTIPGASALLGVPAVLAITGDDAAADPADEVRLVRDPDNPLLLDVSLNGRSDPGQLPLAAIERITFAGGLGGDTLIVDSSHGPISVPGGISFDGGLGSDTAEIRARTGPGRADTELAIRRPTPADPSGQNILSGAVLGGDAVQTVELHDVESMTAGAASPAANPLAAIRAGLDRLAGWSGRLNNRQLLATSLPVIGSGLGNLLAGASAEDAVPAGDAEAGEPKAIDAAPGGSTLLRRLIETGPASFRIADIGGGIDSPEALRALLDGLDGTDGNVTFRERDGVTTFDAQVEQILSARIPLDISALGGSIEFGGTLDASATVHVHLVFGADANGFFLDERNPDPELVVSRFEVTGDAMASGRFGFLSVTASDPVLTTDPAIRLEVYLDEPGPVRDGFIRPDELERAGASLASARLVSAPGQEIVLTAAFAASATIPGGPPALPLVDARVSVVWPDATSLDAVRLRAETTTGAQDLLRFLDLSASQITTGVNHLAGSIERLTGVDLLGTRIPLLGRSLGEVLDTLPRELVFANGAAAERDGNVLRVSPVSEDSGTRRFTVEIEGGNLGQTGIATGNRVTYRATSGTELAEGVVEGIDGAEVTVRMGGGPARDPDTIDPEFHIFRSGSLQNQLTAALGGLTNPATLAVRVPTIQDLVSELAETIGVDISDIALRYAAGDSIEISFSLNPDPMRFSQVLDLSAAVPGIDLEGGVEFSLTADTEFHVTAGLRLGDGLAPEDRFYIVPAETSAVVHVTAQANPRATARLGFLDLLVRPDPAAPHEPSGCTGLDENDGICLAGTLTVALADPASDAGRRVTLRELSGSMLAPHTAIDATLDIDGIEIAAGVGSSTLGTIRISLDGSSGPDAAGHITSLSGDPASGAHGLAGLGSAIRVDGAAPFLEFNNITPDMIVSALAALIDHLHRVGSSGVFATRLPLVGARISDIVDVSHDLLARLDGDPTTPEVFDGINGTAVATAAALERFLNNAIDPARDVVQVRLDPGEIRFTFRYDAHVGGRLPIAFDLGSGGLGLVGSGTFEVSGAASVALTLGVRTAAGLELPDRIFLETSETGGGSPDPEVSIDARLNAGYDGADPLILAASVGGFHVDVPQARGLIELHLAADLQGRDDDQLTLREIAAGAFDIRPSFSGKVQGFVALDGGPAGIPAIHGTTLVPEELADTADAVVELAGRLENLPAGIAFADPELHANIDRSADDATLADPRFDSNILVYVHNLDGFVEHGLLNLTSLLDGLDQFLEWADALLASDPLNFRLPVIGASLHDALNFIETAACPASGLPQSFGDLVGCLRAAAGTALDPSSDDAAVVAAAQRLADVLADLPGIYPIGDGNGDGTVADERDPDGTLQSGEDLVRIEQSPEGAVLGVTYLVRFAPSLSRTIPTGFDLGTDFLRVHSTSALTFSGTLEAFLGFGISKSAGFFIKTDFCDVPLAVVSCDPATERSTTPEISLTGTIELSGDGDAATPAGSPADIELELGFLGLRGELDAHRNFLSLSLTADLRGGTTDAEDDRRLTTDELFDFGTVGNLVDSTARVEARLDVPLSVDAGSELPELSAEFVVAWGPFTLDDVRSGALAFTDPMIELRNVRLSVGAVLERLAGPVLREIERYNVLAPVIDALDDPLPIIGKTPFQLLVTENPLLSERDRALAGFLFEIASTVSEVSARATDANGYDSDDDGTADGLFVEFGNVGLTRALVWGDAAGAGMATPAADDPAPGSGLPLVGGFFHNLGEIGVTFPVLELSSLVQLFVGNDTDLVVLDLPRLDAHYDFPGVHIPLFSFGIPLLADVFVEAFVTGRVGLVADVAAGLDTRGLRRGISHLLDGFYVGDFDPGPNHRIEPSDAERPEVSLSFSVEAGIEAGVRVLGFPFAELTGSGRITAAIGVDLNDDNEQGGVPLPGDDRTPQARHDGRMYLDEIGTIIRTGGDALCLFDLVGSLTAALGIHIEVDLLIDSLEFDREREWNLLQFEEGCTPPERDLANLVGDQLALTSTASTTDGDLDTRAGTNHPGGDRVDILLVDKDSNPATGGSSGKETLRVRKDGFNEDFGPGETGPNHLDDVSTIRLITDLAPGADPERRYELGGFGDGPDTVVVDPLLRIRVRLDGGAGDDVLTGGSAGGTLRGGDGDDALALALAPSDLTACERLGGDIVGDGCTEPGWGVLLVGGAGNDVLSAGPGDDVLVGDYDLPLPDPAQRGEGSDVLGGAEGNDTIWGDNQGAAGDGDPPDASLTTDDQIAAGSGDDVVFAGPGNDRVEADDVFIGTDRRTISCGTAGRDEVFGGTGNDFLVGCDGRDVLVGESGDDHIDGGPDDDLVYGGDRTLGPNRRGMGRDELRGGDGADLLDGSDSDAVVARGGAGADVMIGSRGADNLSGESGDDTIVAGPGSDVAEGGSENDCILGGAGSVGGSELFPIFFPNQPDISDGSDRLFGDDGDDVLLGDNGSACGKLGSETDPRGGAGSDVIAGGPGTDLIFGGGYGDFLFARDYVPPGTAPTIIICEPGGSCGEPNFLVGDQGALFRSLSPDEIRLATASSPIAHSAGDDTVTGDIGNDAVLGGEGADSVSGGLGRDILIGDSGRFSIPPLPRFSLADFTITQFTVDDADAPSGGNDQVDGGAGDDILIGGAFDDLLVGAQGNDLLFGDLAAVTLNGTTSIRAISLFNDIGGQDSLDGGDGEDTAVGGPKKDVIIGGDDDAADFLFGDAANVIGNDGSPDANDIYSVSTTSGGQDTVTGGPGNDVLVGDASGDELLGGGGNDRLVGDGAHVFRDASGAVERIELIVDPGSDLIDGGEGNDSIQGGGGNDSVTGGLGDDLFDGGTGLDRLVESADADLILADLPAPLTAILTGLGVDNLSGIEAAYLQGGPGANLLNAAAFSGPVTLVGGDGDDVLVGGRNHDSLIGGAGNDMVSGGMGDDALDGGPDTDLLFESDDASFTLKDTELERRLATGAVSGVDRLSGMERARLVGGAGDNELRASDFGGPVTLEGGAGNDRLLGGHTADLLLGGSGNDTLRGGPGDDTLRGGDDNDRLRELAGNNVLFGEAGDDRLTGGVDGDTLDGGGGADRLNDLGGNNILIGGRGVDRLTGAAGRDILIGGANADLIQGIGEQDILIGGDVRFGAATDIALDRILLEWGSARPYAVRVRNIRGTGTGPRLNEGFFLQKGVTVLDDAVVDQLLGGVPERDWFFLFPGDTSDRTGEERVN